MNCCICGTVKNCGPYLAKVLRNMEKLGSLFQDYQILIYYDKSTDNTLNILNNYQKTNPKMSFYININAMYPYRTHNLAKARNYCLKYVIKNKDRFPFFIMMDCDDVSCKELNTDILKNHLSMNTWDGLSFNTSPHYYDIWGLSIYPFCYSYNHFNNSYVYHGIIQRCVEEALEKCKKNGTLLECISSFNGFSIYRTEKFTNTYYDGRIRLNLIPKEYLNAHKRVTNSGLVFKKYECAGYPSIEGKYEDCEHRIFHILAKTNSGARIMISPHVIFV